MRQVHKSSGFDDQFKSLLDDPNYDPILIQKVTVLQNRQQHEFEKALFCAWLGSLIAVEMGLARDLVYASFLAGLVHDIGFLHIPADIVHKRGDMPAAEWKAIQSHVVIGHMLIKNMKGASQRAATAVLEHHERCDGAGYPVGRMSEKLDLLGQVVGMADSIHAIRINQFAKVGRNLRDAMPYLRMNTSTHFSAVNNAMHSILKRANIEPSKVNPLNSFDALVEHLMRRGQKLKSAAVLLQDLWILSSANGSGADNKKLERVTRPVLSMMNSSGLLHEEMLHWVGSLLGKSDPETLGDLTEMELMHNELHWQLKNVHRSLREFISEQGSKLHTEQSQRYGAISDEIGKCVQAA